MWCWGLDQWNVRERWNGAEAALCSVSPVWANVPLCSSRMFTRIGSLLQGWMFSQSQWLISLDSLIHPSIPSFGAFFVASRTFLLRSVLAMDALTQELDLSNLAGYSHESQWERMTGGCMVKHTWPFQFQFTSPDKWPFIISHYWMAGSHPNWSNAECPVSHATCWEGIFCVCFLVRIIGPVSHRVAPDYALYLAVFCVSVFWVKYDMNGCASCGYK